MRQHSATVTRVTGLKSAIKGSHCVLAWALARLKAVASTALASERAGHCSNYTRVNATKDGRETIVVRHGVVTRTRVSMGGRAQHKVPAIPANA
jgi:hypothetical protein